MDYLMPHLNGLQTIQQLNADVLDAAKICLMSGCSSQQLPSEDIDMLKQLGVRPLVAKSKSVMKQIWTSYAPSVSTPMVSCS